MNPEQIRHHLDANGLLVRTAQIRAADDTEAMTFTGLGVPYGEVIEHFFGREKFAPGSVDSDGALIMYGHREPVGKLTGGEDVKAGHRIHGKLSATDRGREVHTLMRDEVLTKLSIGFEPLEWTVERDDDGELITFTKVRAREFSIVPFPAYDSAALESVRHRHTPEPSREDHRMDTDTLNRAELDKALEPVTNQLEDFQRQLGVLGQQSRQPAAAAQWRSMGDFLKAVASGDTDAADFHREYTGATTADTVMKDSFVGDFTRLVDERRRLVNTFSRGTLPADGMSVDYYQLDSDTTKVGKQATEGADLPYGKVTLKSANAPVATYGGWTELSRQAIERATVPALNVTLKAMGMQYARVTNAAVAEVFATLVANKLAAATAPEPDTTAAVDLAATATTDEWLDMIVDASLAFEDRGHRLSGMLVTGEVFKELIRLKDGDNRLMNVYGTGQNQVGELDLTSVDGNLAGVTVELLPHTTGRLASFYDPEAIQTLENPGAPAQLQDENIINLSKQFSLYGYQAIIVPFPDAVVPVNFLAA